MSNMSNGIDSQMSMEDGMESRMNMGDSIEGRMESREGPNGVIENEKGWDESPQVTPSKAIRTGSREPSTGGRGRDRPTSAAFSQASDAERGELGGNYTVSGLR